MNNEQLYLTYANILADMLREIKPTHELFNEIIKFLETILGISFTEEQLYNPVINKSIVTFLKNIQMTINIEKEELSKLIDDMLTQK